MDDGQLRFRFADVARELRETESLARKFLDRGSRTGLSTAADQLVRLQRKRGQHEWGLTGELRTQATKGYEQRHRQGAHSIFAAISSTWAITPEDNKTFRVTANVSTRIRLLDPDSGTPWGLWRVELGTKGAPGCFFHTQILGQDEEPPWPRSVPIPRLPTPFVSIPSVLTFVLGELFQSEWARHVGNQRSQRLATDQRAAWERRLMWELGVVRGSGTLPWSRLKAALPPRDLFCEAPTGG